MHSQTLTAEALAILYLFAINGVTYAAFGWDKYCAIHGRWRIRESTLLMFAMLGGTPCAKLAQRILRHKTRKQPFGKVLNSIVILQCLLVVLVAISPARQNVLQAVNAAIGSFAEQPRHKEPVRISRGLGSG